MKDSHWVGLSPLIYRLLRLIFLRAVYEVDEAKGGRMMPKEAEGGQRRSKEVEEGQRSPKLSRRRPMV